MPGDPDDKLAEARTELVRVLNIILRNFWKW
jgi:hypothetical protein